MRQRRFFLAALALVNAAGLSCRQRALKRPSIHRLEPSRIPGHLKTAIAVQGEAFYAKVTGSTISGELNVNARFDLTLFSAGERWRLGSATWVSTKELETIVPAGLPEGFYSLELVDPRGRRVVHDGVVEVVAVEIALGTSCRRDADCLDFCHHRHLCHQGQCLVSEAGRDADGDGYVDAACPTGNDCDDDPSACGERCHPGALETCDGFDNDCNAATADGSGDPDFDAACDGPDDDRCAEGHWACDGKALWCTDQTAAAEERCNGINDDCDDTTADGADDPQVGSPCDGPDHDLCRDDVVECANGVLGCSAGPDTLDLCDGVDNDCDPTSDDGDEDPGTGTACDGADTDACADDLFECTGGMLMCGLSDNGIEGPSDDPSCSDAHDNDCDGESDSSDPGCIPGPRETFELSFTPDVDVGEHADWFDGADTDGCDVVATLGCGGSIGLAAGKWIFTWVAHPFDWNDANTLGVVLQADFQADGEGGFDDDRLGWMITDSTHDSSNIFGVQLDPGGTGLNIEGYWDTPTTADVRPPIVDLTGLIVANAWYRLRATIYKLDATAARIDVSLSELDGNCDPVGTLASGSLPDTRVLGVDAPDPRYFSALQFWPAYKNYDATVGAADNTYAEVIRR